MTTSEKPAGCVWMLIQIILGAIMAAAMLGLVVMVDKLYQHERRLDRIEQHLQLPPFPLLEKD